LNLELGLNPLNSSFLTSALLSQNKEAGTVVVSSIVQLSVQSLCLKYGVAHEFGPLPVVEPSRSKRIALPGKFHLILFVTVSGSYQRFEMVDVLAPKSSGYTQCEHVPRAAASFQL
jgi:hypothetical protein